MSESLLSVGLDVGTTSTQLIVSRLGVENRASAFAVPDLAITRREILYQSPVYFTPLLDESHVDGPGIREIVEREYAAAGIRRQQVQTGAVIITGETSRKENAQAVLTALAELAGDFVVATAGPDLESILAARGSGAVDYSAQTGSAVLHMDIGGGTCNLAWIQEGQIVATGCLNVGGRLIKTDGRGRITYISPVLGELCKLKTGDPAAPQALQPVVEQLVQALEMAAGLRPATELLRRLATREAGDCTFPSQPGMVLSFSGGVADCIDSDRPWEIYGDIGPLLGSAIRRSRLCQGVYRLGEQTIRATVIGAGCHSAQLSGSTVYHRGVRFPLKNLPVAVLSGEKQTLPPARLGDTVAALLEKTEGEAVALVLPGLQAPHYETVRSMAQGIARGFGDRPVIVVTRQDMAKALGHAMALELPRDRAILCIDGLQLSSDSYLDVGAPVGPALPVVIKTLVLSENREDKP